MRRATCAEVRSLEDPVISIHALLAESDYWRMAAVAGCDLFLSTLSLRRATQAVAVPVCQHTNFYPRSPCGERPLEAYTLTTMGIFLSTLSLRRATYRFLGAVPSFCISIHALLAESDLHCKTPITFRHYFYPRSPCGERRRQYRIIVAVG